jgi:hypothetical protein
MYRVFLMVTASLLFFCSYSYAQKDSSSVSSNKRKISTSVGLFGVAVQNYYPLTEKLHAFSELGWLFGVHGGTDKKSELLLTPVIHTELRYFFRDKPVVKPNHIDYSGLNKGLYMGLGNSLNPDTFISEKSIIIGEISGLFFFSQVFLHLGFQGVMGKRFITNVGWGLGYRYSAEPLTPDELLGFSWISGTLRISYFLR